MWAAHACLASLAPQPHQPHPLKCNALLPICPVQLVSLFKEYRVMNAAALRQPNKLIYPPSLRCLPLWTLGMVRSTAFRWDMGGVRGLWGC